MRFFFIFIFLTAGLVTTSYFYLDSTAISEEDLLVASVQRRDFTVELNVIGVLDAAQSHMVAAELQGSQGKIIFLIDDGTKVSKGDLLVQFDPLPFRKEVELLTAQVASFEAAVQAAEQGVEFEKNQVQREIANAEYLLSVAELDFKRLDEGEGPLRLSQLQEEQQKAELELQRHERYYKELLELKADGFSNDSEIEAIAEKVDVLKKQFETTTRRYDSYKDHVLPALREGGRAKKLNAELVLKQTSQGGVFKIAKAQATLNQVKSKLEAQRTALQQAERQLEKTKIHAPFDGIVILYETFREGEERKPREGDLVFMNQPILYLPDVSRMVVKTKAREIDLYKLFLGQRGRVRIDAYPDTSFEAELIYIGALATAESSKSGQEKYFQVTFSLKDEDTRLRPGMTCRIAILAQSLQQVLTVPLQAVFLEGNQKYTYVRNGLGSLEAREVTVGAQNENMVEIISGLSEGEEVSLVKPGQ